MKQSILRGVELVAVGESSLTRAKMLVTGCAVCSATASRPFESVLNQVLGNTAAEYFMCSPAECPRCASPIVEHTLVSIDAPFVTAPEDTDVVFVDEPTLREAENFLSGCENCRGEAAEISFDQILDAVTGCDPTVTEYVICHAAKCPTCHHEVMEKTLVVAE